MKMRLGEVFKGIIVGIKSFSMLIELNEFPVIGVIELSSLTDDYYEFYERQNCLIGKKNGKMFKLMDKFEVQVIKVTDDIYFSLFEF